MRRDENAGFKRLRLAAFLLPAYAQGSNPLARLDASLRRWMGVGSLSRSGFEVIIRRVGHRTLNTRRGNQRPGTFGGEDERRLDKTRGGHGDDEDEEDSDGDGDGDDEGSPLPEATRRLSIVLSIVKPQPRSAPSTSTSTRGVVNDARDEGGSGEGDGGAGTGGARHPETPEVFKYHALMRRVKVPAPPQAAPPPRAGGAGASGRRGFGVSKTPPPPPPLRVTAPPPAACFAAWNAAAGTLALAGEPEVRRTGPCFQFTRCACE